MQMNLQRSALIILASLGLSGCGAYLTTPAPPLPVRPLYHCVATGQYGAQWSWVSGSQQVAINRALLECQREGGQNCQITSCRVKYKN